MFRNRQQLRRAIEYIGRQQRHDTEFIEFTARRFDLTPLEEQFLLDEFGEGMPTRALDSAVKELSAYSFLRALAAEELINAQELEFLERIALRDGQIDAEERAVLSGLFAGVRQELLEPQVRAEIEHFKRNHDIP